MNNLFTKKEFWLNLDRLITNRWSRYIYSLFILATVTFIAHFWHYHNLGLYEDDYFLIGHIMSMNLDEFGDFFQWHILNFNVTEGRPLLYIIEFSVGLIGNLISDFKALYLIDYAVVLINNTLVYIFLKSLCQQPVFYITGTLAFVLFPADTNHAYLTHICLHTSLTFLLLAFLAYFDQRKILSYLLIFSSIFCYETVFLLFLTAPLFQNKWDKNILKKMVKHVLILGAMLVIVFIARKLTGEARISELDLTTLIWTPLRQMAIGSVVSLSMFGYRPVQTLLNLKGEILIFVTIFFFIFILLFSNLKSDSVNNNNISISSQIKKLTILGLSLLVLSYPLMFTRAATAINGRDSRVHMTGAIGACILVGLVCYGIIYLANNNLTKNIVNGALALFFSLLVGFGLTIQQENQMSWEYQRSFWTDVVHLCPDIVPETIILVDAPHINQGQHLHAFDEWGVPMTLRQIYKFPQTWSRLDDLPKTDDRPRWYYWRKYTMYPKVYRLSDHWQDLIVKQGKFDFNPQNKAFDYFLQWEPPRLIDSHNIILLEERNGKLSRRSEPLKIGNEFFEFKSLTEATIQDLESGVLYDYLIKQDDEMKVTRTSSGAASSLMKVNYLM